MSARRAAKKGRSKSKKEDTPADIVSLQTGWEKINEVGVTPYFNRIENLDEKQFKEQSIPSDQYLQTYDTIFNMCIQREPYNHSEPLYNKHTDSLTHYAKQQVLPALADAKNKNYLTFLREWVKRWRNNKWIVDGMRRMFMYLDRFFVPNSEDLLPTSEQGYTIFRSTVFDQFKNYAREAILDCVRREREHEDQDRDLLRQAIFVFVELGQKLSKVELTIYTDDFQKKFVAMTRQFYLVKSRQWMDQDSCPDYMVKAEKCIESEESRLASYLHNQTKEPLMKAVRQELLKNHQVELLNKETGIAALMEKESQIDLARMYRLFEAVPGGLEPVADAMCKHITKLGNNYIQQSKTQSGADKEHRLIRNLISLHERFHGIVEKHFHNHQLFQKALKEAFEDFINKEYYTSNLLAKYIHEVLKKGSKVSVGDMEGTLDHVVMLYGYIRDKDIFERDYQQYLATRLLQGQSQSEQHEKRMIAKLKTECGYQWTSKLESMFKDVQLSAELVHNFKSGPGAKHDAELEVNVCTTGSWPQAGVGAASSGAKAAISQGGNLPQQVHPVCDAFKNFYLNKHSGRRLTWRMDQGRADVMIMFTPQTRKILNVSTYQMMFLTLFNNSEFLSYQQVLDVTACDADEMQAHVLSLAHPKVCIVEKNPNNNKLAPNHKFRLNKKYKNQLFKIKVPVLQNLGKNNDAKRADIEQQTKIRRRHQIDAAIVRIMKTRKTLKHQALIGEVVDQLKARFSPSSVDIKKRIESLIEQEYLERDENQRGTYNYKA